MIKKSFPYVSNNAIVKTISLCAYKGNFALLIRSGLGAVKKRYFGRPTSYPTLVVNHERYLGMRGHNKMFLLIFSSVCHLVVVVKDSKFLFLLFCVLLSGQRGKLS